MKNTLSRLGCTVFATGLLTCLSTPAEAQSVVFMDLTTFSTAIQGGSSYTQNFNTGAVASAPSFSFAGNGFGYTVTTSDANTYESGTIIGTNLPNVSLIVNFTTANVRAVGGNFFLTNISDAFVAGPVTLSLSDGTTTTYTPASTSTFRGFVSPLPITSLTFAAPTTASTYASLDNLTVGAVVPEPATWVLLSIAGAGAGVMTMRRRRVVA